jgi:cytochrome P450
MDVNPNETWGSLIKLSEKYGMSSIDTFLHQEVHKITHSIGPIFKITVLGKQLVFISNVSLLEEICDEKRFRKCVTGPVVEMRQLANNCLFTAYDNESIWGVSHRIMAPYVSGAAVDKCYSDMANVIADLTKKWTSGVNKKVLFTSDLDRLLMTSVMQCFFNQRIDILEGPEHPLIHAWESITWEAMKRPTRPKMLNWLLYERGFKNNIKYMRGFATEIVKSRKENPAQARDDLLNGLLHAADPQTGEKLTDTQVVDEVVTMFIGAATSANLVAFALYYLIKNPEKIIKARAEIDSVVGPNEQIQLEDLKKLQYCEGIIRESLRLSATAPGFNIEPIPRATDDKSPILLAGGKYQIPYNQAMICILHTVNRDPEVFEDPETFSPERVLGEKWHNLPKGAKRNFGNGKRECYGTMWAWRWSIFTLVSILKDVDLAFEDPNYELTCNGAFTVKPLEFNGLVNSRKR